MWVAWQFRLPPTSPDLPTNYRAEKAAWLEITWAMDAHSDGEIQSLAQNLQQHHITTLFAYVSYLKPGNVFNPTYDHAADFVRQLHEAAPQINVLAWIGVPVQYTTTSGEYVTNRLEDSNTRTIIAEFAARTVNEFGFDGVHLNAEAIADGDSAFIETLQAIRAQLPKTALLSTTARALQMTEWVTIFPFPIASDQRSMNYLREIAQNSDQVVIMAYDSGLFFPSDYRAWMQYQVQTSAAALNDLDVDFLVGVPVSEEWTLSHNITTEYLANALYGVRAGLAASISPNNVDGIAIYPYWEIDDGEWVLVDKFP